MRLGSLMTCPGRVTHDSVSVFFPFPVKKDGMGGMGTLEGMGGMGVLGQPLKRPAKSTMGMSSSKESPLKREARMDSSCSFSACALPAFLPAR